MSIDSNRVVGKPRKPWPMFESAEKFCGWAHCPSGLVKLAKQKGCKAFITGHRIDSGLLVPFLFDLLNSEQELPEGVTTWKEANEKFSALRSQLKLEEEKRSLMPTADAERQAAEACNFVDSELQRGENELPPVLAGLPAVECGKILHSFTERLRSAAKKQFSQIGQ